MLPRSPFCMALSVSFANVSMSRPFDELGDFGAAAAGRVLRDRRTARKEMAYRQANKSTKGGAWWPGIWMDDQYFRDSKVG